VHRDVKLDNILVDAAGSADERAVLTDFGMCFDLLFTHLHAVYTAH
jgi:serine/threonine protein kinase